MPAFQTLDEAVYFWYMNEKQNGVYVSSLEIQSYAMKLNKDLGGNPSFVASTGWLNRWKRRHGLKISRTTAESTSKLPVKMSVTIGQPFTLDNKNVKFDENIVANVDVSKDTAFINDDADEQFYQFTLYQPGQGRDDILPEVGDFREITKRDALNQMQKELNFLLSTVPENKLSLVTKEVEGFTHLFSRYLADHDPYISWEKIEKLPNDAIIDYDTFNIPTMEQAREMLNKLIVVKLNGGLGTSMGCRGPKSVIPVRNDQTFLDLTVQQIEHINKKYDVNVPLILMNSFNTDSDTEKVIRKYKGLRIEIYTFNQSCYPRVNRDSLLPVPNSYDIENNLESWYPPGHGDFYGSFKNSGLLKIFLERKREYCFISNIDNLGATVDLNILNVLLNDKRQGGPEFVMEITDKTKADVKGGTLIQYEGKMHLLEIAQVPKDHVDDFKSVKCFKYFNTNNLWVKLSAIDRVLSEQKLHLDVIVNNKTLENNLNVIQLETAVGAAVKSFDGGLGVLVPRRRFLPVKKTSDLLLVMSNLYNLKSAALSMSSQRMFPTTPLIKLGDKHFSKVKDFLSRFVTIPDIIELDHLTVSGDVTFGKGVSLKGTVIIIANHGDRIDIPSGAILENKIVSGNLRILDH